MRLPGIGRGLFAAGVVFAASCSAPTDATNSNTNGNGPPPPDVTPASVRAADTTTLAGHVGVALPAPLGVVVTNASGAALTGISVAWAVTAGGGTLSAASSSTDASGVARINWTLGAHAGINTVTATVGTLTPVTFSATAIDDAPASMQRAGADSLQTWIGDSLPASPAVKILTSSGAPVIGDTVTWTVTAGGGTLSAASTVTDTSGIARVRWTLGATPGPNTLRAQSGSLSPVDFTATALARVATTLSLTRDTLRFNYWGDTSRVSAAASDVEGVSVSPGALTWSSSDTAVATVDATGRLTVVGGGETTIAAHAGSLSATMSVKVAMPVLTTPFLDTATVYTFAYVFGEDFHIAGKPLNPTWEIDTHGYGMAVRAVTPGVVILITPQPTTSDYEIYFQPIGSAQGNETWAMSYDHVIAPSVAVGDVVAAGDSIGAVQRFDTVSGVGQTGRVEFSVWYNLANGNADMMCPARLGTAAFNGIFDRLRQRFRPDLATDCLLQDLVLVPVAQSRVPARRSPLAPPSGPPLKPATPRRSSSRSAPVASRNR